MLSLILIWCYISIIMLIYGIVAVKLLHYLTKNNDQPYPPITIIFILGLCLITTISGYLSLIINLGLGAFLLISLVAVYLFYYYFHNITGLFRGYLNKLGSMEKIVIIIFGLTIFFILVKSAQPPASVDSGLYHAQAIKWIEEYRVVPGLGNLHGRLAFNFSWFLPSALFSLAFLKIQPFHVLNPLMLIFVLVMSFEAGDELLKGHYSLANLLKVSIIIPATLVFKEQLSSPNVDLPTSLLILVLFIYFIEMLEEERLLINGPGPMIITILAAYLITIKLSGIAVTMFVGYICFRKILEKKHKDLVLILGIITIILVPWIIRSVILSGYLVYPVPSVDLINCDWKIPLPAVLAESQGISNYARNPGLIPDEWLSRGLSAWFPSWLHYTITAYGKKLALILLPPLILFGAVMTNSFKEKSLKINGDVVRRYKIVYLTAVLGLIFWFVSAPDLRLGFGFIIITPLLLLMPLAAAYRPLVPKAVLVLIAVFLFYFEAAFIGGDLAGMQRRLLLPAPYPQVALRTIRAGDQVVYVPQAKAGLCWYAPLPCTPSPVANLEFRGDNLQDGFRSKKE